MGLKVKTDLNTKGISDLQKKLKKMQEKLKKYDGEQEVKLPYSQEEWEKMTEYERNEAIEEAKRKYIEEMKKDIFK